MAIFLGNVHKRGEPPVQFFNVSPVWQSLFPLKENLPGWASHCLVNIAICMHIIQIALSQCYTISRFVHGHDDQDVLEKFERRPGE